MSGRSAQGQRLCCGTEQGEWTACGRAVAGTQVVVKSEGVAGTEDYLSVRSTWGRESNKWNWGAGSWGLGVGL